ncbi:MAG TPA: hemerythrin domain-containing protein [Anaeromyxobacter sp.]
MDAIAYLRDQHQEIHSLFDQIETAARTQTRRRLWRKLVDLLAVHTAVEEMIFYPAAHVAAVEELLPRAIGGHASTERIVADIVAAGLGSDRAAAKLALLKERKRRHAEEEERELFPRVRELLTSGELELVGERMASVADRLMEPGVGARERIGARHAVA